jgi:hypothetical protein
MTSPETDPDMLPTAGQHQQGTLGSTDVFVSVVGQNQQARGGDPSSLGSGAVVANRDAPTTTVFSVPEPASAPIYNKAPNLPMPPMPNVGYSV